MWGENDSTVTQVPASKTVLATVVWRYAPGCSSKFKSRPERSKKCSMRKRARNISGLRCYRLPDPAVAGAMEDPSLCTDDVGQQFQPDPFPECSESFTNAVPCDEEPLDEEMVVEEPAVEETVVEEPIVEEPVVEEPVVGEPIVEEAIVEEPVFEEQVDEGTVVEELVNEEPVYGEPADANHGEG